MNTRSKRIKKNIQILSVAIILLHISILSANSIYSKQIKTKALGGTLGWGCPFGNGLFLENALSQYLALRSGFGMALSGPRIGIGTRYYFNLEKIYSPFIELSYAHSFGINDVKISVKQDSAFYHYGSSENIHIRTGIKYDYLFLTFYGNLGYGFSFGDGKAEYIEGNQIKSVNDMAEILESGGLEISAGTSIRF